ncbi:MAG: hypothetical protein ACPG5B_02765 [Chitinophagales bacterium]
MKLKKITLLVLAALLCNLAFAKVNIGIDSPNNNGAQSGKTNADCNSPTAQIELNINNVRTTLMTGGDLWWDLSDGKYEVPKIPIGSDAPSVHSIFAGSLWIGGIDQFQNLKVAAQTYRQSGNDFWAGPLDEDGEIAQEVCSDFDRFWVVYRRDIDDYLSALEEANGELSPGAIPDAILQWPGKDNIYHEAFSLPENKILAPFWDADGDGRYDPTVGDYPVIDPEIEGVYADQMIWWMFNDKGNVHTETGGEAIGIEVGALAFAFATNDEVNNMTFYKYRVNNKSVQPVDSVFFGQWVDPDLGTYDDDFVGCVPEEGLGIVYNGTAVDGQYGENPPMLGVDFFRGPKVGEDEDGNPNYLDMSAFVYYDNDFSVRGNPENASHFYGYLAGVWKDGTPFTCGGNGYGGDEGCDYIFPGDPSNPDEWSECSENNTPFDRRFLQSAGPFRLDPGASNDVIVGVVWVNEGFQYPCPSFDAILQADRKAQALFDNNFKLKDGPDAPNMIVRELDKELILAIWNDETRSNNASEAYVEVDPVLEAQGFENDTYTFQGYKLYQLANVGVSPAEYGDPDKARLIAIVDVKDGVQEIINYTANSEVGSLVPELMVDAEDSGIRHTFRIQENLFATGDKKLINNQKYYFSVLTYGYNAHEPYDPSSPSATAQLEPYIEGRNNIKIYTGIPHLVTPQNDGVVVNTAFGEGPEVKQISGTGNGGNFLDLTDASIATILADGSIAQPVYANAAGPINVKIFDPLQIPATTYTLKIKNASDSTTVLSKDSEWTLYDKNTGDIVAVSDTSIYRENEQAIPSWQNSLGFTINIKQQEVTSGMVDNNIAAEARFKDVQNQWLSLFADAEGNSVFNWIKAGNFTNSDNSDYNDNRTGSAGDFFDPAQLYETIGAGRFAPYCLTNHKPGSGTDRIIAPACTDCSSQPTLNLEDLSSVNLVFTNDQTLWTDCIVVETGSDASINEGKANKNGLREQVAAGSTTVSSLSANQTYFVAGSTASYVTYTNASGAEQQVAGNTFFRSDASTGFNAFNSAMVYNASDVGRSQFPGYAINVETGERLNVIFGENSFLGNENGKDLIFNPTSTIVSQNGFTGPQAVALGGQHFVYVMGTKYDGGAAHQEKLIDYAISTESTVDVAPKLEVYDDAMWVTIPFLTPGFSLKSLEDGLIPTDVNIKLRVARPYQQVDSLTTELEYEFDFTNLAAQTGQTDIAKNALDLVKIVPNPYYAYSTYENNQLDNRVKITNLPAKTNISIFTLEGTLIKTIATDNTGLDTAAGNEAGKSSINTVEWDVKNAQSIPIASGVYLIHIEAPELGEEITLKWFCLTRPTDLDVF